MTLMMFDALDRAGVEPMLASGEDAVPVDLQVLAEQIHGWNLALPCLGAAMFPSLLGPCRAAVEPQAP